MPSKGNQEAQCKKNQRNRQPHRRLYHGPSNDYEYNGNIYHSYGEVRLAKIFTEQMKDPVPFTAHVREECADLDGKFIYEPDFFTERDVKFPGMGFGARYFEVKGFLTRKAVRKMRALENKTGHKGWILLPGHLKFIEQEGTEWKREDFLNFEPPDFTKNCDKGAILELRKLLVREGIPFEESAEFECMAWKGDQRIRFIFIGHFYFPEPRKLFGIPHPVQVLRVVDEIKKNEIIAMESLSASAEVNGYLVLKSHVFTWKKEGLVKRGRHRPLRSVPGPLTGSQNGHSHIKDDRIRRDYRDQECKKRKNGVKRKKHTPPQ